MVTLLLDQRQLEIVLTRVERLLAAQRGDLRIDRGSIAKLQLTDEPATWLRGVRAPGIHLPRLLSLGTWRSAQGNDFVAIRHGRPGVVIDLDGDARFSRLILSTRHGHALAKALRLEAGEAEG
ncbi:hypothetical protein ACH0AH_04255 [Microbacterium paludicola]|uniref:Uncharacterized protein n=1 Tax=Microbacterium paludicola TaxID=300019 RepID=A0A4Y9FUJ9_9MICO|nr:hypothetical protein [Microbacterium paludicola]MBF0817068.1 hypothetical protein [Microbacterium paludicola]TFU32201.1 hypothetical protein E4U02_11630 [Microbacterium paludicola]